MNKIKLIETYCNTSVLGLNNNYHQRKKKINLVEHEISRNMLPQRSEIILGVLGWTKEWGDKQMRIFTIFINQMRDIYLLTPTHGWIFRHFSYDC